MGVARGPMDHRSRRPGALLDIMRSLAVDLDEPAGRRNFPLGPRRHRAGETDKARDDEEDAGKTPFQCGPAGPGAGTSAPAYFFAAICTRSRRIFRAPSSRSLGWEKSPRKTIFMSGRTLASDPCLAI